ncbi:porin OmpC [Salmonella enterica]|nr:porin OmpC [Salmonella enterica]ECA7253991.1 porin OmpC [Salmonella enterica subsp. enterica serovar Oranienburg]EDR7079802.1 porin OmpC [Salmonella enterica subsp. enterica serovar Gatuni]EDT0687026.1 porin OmpC [Salmonella enterica subsp. enterica serovar Kokomlemle]EDU5440757.1 porin OmpC [Salmonella enterica subsp. enterica serovar Hadar]EHL0896709.1 porin OmpC [Salmonella enterica subsp. enterica serovar Durban]
MKKLAVALTAVAVAVMSAGVANAAEIYNKDANKLDLYGKLDGLHYFSGDRARDGDQSYIRLGIKGETQINDQVTGYGQWEQQVNVNRPEDGDDMDSPQSWTRLGFAGLSFGDYGSVDYGRNYGVLYDIGAWTDMLPEFGNDSYEASDNFMTGRANGLLTYRNTGFFGLVDGLNFALQYQGKNDGHGRDGDAWKGAPLSNNARGIAEQNGDGFGISATYDFGTGVSAGAAYTNSNRTSEQKWRGGDNDGGNKAEAWTAGLKYDANDIYLAANYTQTHNMTWFGITNNSRIGRDTPDNNEYEGDFAHKTDNWEVVAQYQFDSGLRPSLAYIQSRARDTGYGNFDLVKYTDVGATYNFNKNMSAYVDYKINMLRHDNPAGLNTDNIVATGLVYQF